MFMFSVALFLSVVTHEVLIYGRAFSITLEHNWM